MDFVTYALCIRCKQVRILAKIRSLHADFCIASDFLPSMDSRLALLEATIFLLQSMRGSFAIC